MASAPAPVPVRGDLVHTTAETASSRLSRVADAFWDALLILVAPMLLVTYETAVAVVKVADRTR